jgi:NTE family protein
VALTKQDGKEVEIELLKRGTSFGIISLFNDEPHSVTARSIETSFILRMEKEKFKYFLNTHPLISLDFTQILSQRIRGRTKPKKIFQCKRTGITGFDFCGKTTYILNLGLKLKEQTQKRVVCVEMSCSDTFTLGSLLGSNYKVLMLDEAREEIISEYIMCNKVDYLSVKIGNGRNFSSLINFLSESYHFILFEIPSNIDKDLFQDFTLYSDQLHLLVFSKREELEKAGLLINELQSKNPLGSEKIKIILNKFGRCDNLTFEEEKNILNRPVYAVLPSYENEEYFKAIRRIARQVGEVVVGLVLGSGAAYGFSHIGVLKTLEKNNIPVDIICGSSMGAVIAALWAVGYSIEDIKKCSKEFGKKLSFFSFWGFSFPFKGIIRAKYLEGILKSFFKNKTFYELKHSLKLVVFDFYKREALVLEEGLLYKAVAASCAMPGIFEPIQFKKDVFLDGGILNPLPTKVILNYGANKIIAVNITPSREEIFKEYQRRNKLHIFDFIFGSIETMQREFIQQAVGIADVVIHPQFEGLGWMEFDKIEEFIERGERAALGKLDEIKKGIGV